MGEELALVGVRFGCVLKTRALLCEVYIRAPDFWTFPNGNDCCERCHVQDDIVARAFGVNVFPTSNEYLCMDLKVGSPTSRK